MSSTTTERPIDLATLAAELGGVGLSMTEIGTQRTITCDDESVTVEALQAAVDAHASPPPPAPSLEERLAVAQAELAEIARLLAERDSTT